MNNDIYDDAFSNVDHEASDVRIQSTLESVCSHGSTLELQSPYETPDTLTQVVRSHTPNPYEELNNDGWGEIFPINVQLVATNHLQHENGNRNLYNDTSSNVNDDTSDVTIQPSPTRVLQRTIQESLPYETLNVLTQVVRSHQIAPYEELNNDVLRETSPTNVKQVTSAMPMPDGVVNPPLPPIYLDLVNETALYEPYIVSTSLLATHSDEVVSTDLQVISRDNSNQEESFHLSTDSLNLGEIVTTRPTAVMREYDCINEYCDIPVDHEQVIEPLTIEKEQWGVRSPTSRQLPVVPLDIYEPLNRSTRLSNTNVRNIIVVPRACKSIAKIVLVLTGLAVVVVLTLVINTAVLNGTSDKIGKILLIQIIFDFNDTQ